VYPPPKAKVDPEMLSSYWLHVLALSLWVLVVRMEREASPGEAPGEDLADLVRRIQAGDPAAESELVARFSHGLLLMLRRLVRNPALADDLHQETFRIVLERLRKRELDDPAGLAGFLRGTARNLMIAERRKTARRRTESDDEEVAQAVHPAPSQLSTVLLDEEAETVRRLIPGATALQERIGEAGRRGYVKRLEKIFAPDTSYAQHMRVA